jgi:hypothetical protein
VAPRTAATSKACASGSSVGQVEGSKAKSTLPPPSALPGEGRHLDAGFHQDVADATHLVQAHAEQVAAVDGAHVEAADVVFDAEREHFGQRRADLVADHGQGKAGRAHLLTLLCGRLFG